MAGMEGLTLKLRHGTPPFAVLANDAPLATGLMTREARLPHPGAGYSTLQVVDAAGASASVQVLLD